LARFAKSARLARFAMLLADVVVLADLVDLIKPGNSKDFFLHEYAILKHNPPTSWESA